MKRRNEGFSLIEILITMAVGIIVVGAIYAAVVSTQRSASGVERKVSVGQDVRAAIGIMEAEIRMASYNSTRASNIWKDSDCALSLSQSGKGIQTATADTITIEMDLNDSGVIGDVANEIITYSYDSDDEYISRKACIDSADCGTAEPFLGDTTASGRPKNVRVVNNQVNQPVFRYFDGRGVETTVAADIRRVEIVLVVDSEKISPGSGKPYRVIYKTSVIPRNHGIVQ
jgi:type II secretory pathway component PulJ